MSTPDLPMRSCNGCFFCNEADEVTPDLSILFYCHDCESLTTLKQIQESEQLPGDFQHGRHCQVYRQGYCDCSDLVDECQCLVCGSNTTGIVATCKPCCLLRTEVTEQEKVDYLLQMARSTLSQIQQAIGDSYTGLEDALSYLLRRTGHSREMIDRFVVRKKLQDLRYGKDDGGDDDEDDDYEDESDDDLSDDGGDSDISMTDESDFQVSEPEEGDEDGEEEDEDDEQDEEDSHMSDGEGPVKKRRTVGGTEAELDQTI